jgi:hypothetical protein
MCAEERFLKVSVKVQFLGVLYKIKKKRLAWRSCRFICHSVTKYRRQVLLRNHALVNIVSENWYFTYGSKGVSATLSHNSLLISVKLEIGYLRLHLHENY